MQTKNIKNLKELKNNCVKLAKELAIPQLILLKGPLAVGKSQMIRYMVEALGFPKEQICSPTFSLINVYKKPNKEFIYHVDLFRLKNETELETTAFWDIFYLETMVFIEWPELIKEKLPPLWNKLYIELSFSNDQESRILKWRHNKHSLSFSQQT